MAVACRLRLPYLGTLWSQRELPFLPRAELEDTKKNLDQSKKSIYFPNRSLTQVERGKEEALEVQDLQDSIRALEAMVDSSFGDGYFFASNEVARALHLPFDLKATLGWDREQIKARITQLSGITEGAFSDPPAHQDGQMQNVGDPTETETKLMKVVVALAEPRVLGAGENLADAGTKVAEEADITGQNYGIREKKDVDDA
ncbi:hypothetical protein Q3G72_001657 [Acer saccharum]|nr:hypothetical protein Q3G72_001657 [Acer saccharum]